MSKKTFSEKIKDTLLNEVLIVTLLAILMGLVVGAIVLLLAGYNPAEAYKTMFLGIVSRPKYIGWTLVRSTPLILTGLSVAFAFRTGLFNIGAEGQFMVGVLVAGVLGYLIELPAIIHLPLVIIGATVAAGLYGGLAGYFKAKYGVHEVISTIMLNWIALYFSNYMVYRPYLKIHNQKQRMIFTKRLVLPLIGYNHYLVDLLSQLGFIYFSNCCYMGFLLLI